MQILYIRTDIGFQGIDGAIKVKSTHGLMSFRTEVQIPILRIEKWVNLILDCINRSLDFNRFIPFICCILSLNVDI